MGQSQLIEPQLHALDRHTLKEYEEVIDRGLKTFVEVGSALISIRDHPRKLYREYGTFEDYCRERWGMARNYANKMIAAAEIVDRLGTVVPILPTNEAQARPLSRLEPEQQIQAWQQAVETAPNGKVTAAHVEQVAREFKPAIAKPESVPPPIIEPEPIVAATHLAPMAVHFSSATPEWYTPRNIIDRVLEFFDEIDLDPCSNSKTNPNVPARQVYTEADDGLAQPWWGRVYVNPPYGDGIGRWTQKARDSYEAWREWASEPENEAPRVEAILLLLPARTDTEWFSHLQNYAVCFIRGRLKFVGAENSAPFPSMLVYLGDESDRFNRIMSPLGRVWTALPEVKS
jgi:hypothetical protein